MCTKLLWLCISHNLCTPVQPPAPPRPNQMPTLAELQTFIVNGETVSIITDVADNWKSLCVAFNFDPNGRTLKRIEQRYPNQAEDCCREMFQTWLKVQGASWKSLITILESCSERLLAKHVKTYVSQQEGDVGCGFPEGRALYLGTAINFAQCPKILCMYM